MTRVEWWALAQTDPVAAAHAWQTLESADRRFIRHAVDQAQRRTGLLEGHIRELAAQLGSVIEDTDLDALIQSWPSAGGLSEHLELELAASQQRGGLLNPGEAVPGCGCEHCTGIPADHPARRRRMQDADQRGAHRCEWQRRVAQAKAVPITEVAVLLGLGRPEGRGREVRVRCPFHDDHHPSLSLNDQKNAWYCHPCGEGGDALGLYMRVKRVGFSQAVCELAL